MSKSTRPLDVVVLVAAVVNEIERRGMNQQQLAAHLGLSPSQVHYSLSAGASAGLWGARRKTVYRNQLREFLEHGVRYAFPAQIGGLVRGVLTRFATPGVLGGPAFVWRSEHGDSEGLEVPPLHRIVPSIAVRDARFGEVMSLVDSLRLGRARERESASQRVRELFAQ